uniref:Ig-like domain-containing protein n=1 Tax=Flavobacterium filum TaxID=370974 RepID=UPI0023F57A08
MMNNYIPLGTRLGTWLKTREPDGHSSFSSSKKRSYGLWLAQLWLFVAVLFFNDVSAQFTYTQNFNTNNGSFTGDFTSFTGATACGGTGGAMRRNIYASQTTGQLISPSVGTSTGGATTVTFDYKVANWSANTAGTPAGWGSFNVQYGMSATGPWTTVFTVNDSNHVVSGSCATFTTPSFTPPAGSLFIRFSATFGTSGDYYLNFDNVSVTQLAPPSCEGQPNAGTISANIASGCSGQTLSLSSTGLSVGLGISYQWQSSPDDSSWTDIPSANSTSYSTPSTAGLTYYRVVTTCSGSGLTNESNSVAFNGLSCGSINIPATGSVNVSCGASTLIYDNGGPSGQYTNNNNGFIVLENSGTGVITLSGSILGFETCCDGLRVYSGVGTGGTLLATITATGSITPIVSAPGQALTVQLFSDVSAVFDGVALQAVYSGVCASCSGAPSNLLAAFSSTTDANLSWNAATPVPADGYEWAVTTSATPPVSGTLTTGLTASIGSLAPATPYYLHVRSVCEEGVDYSSWSTSSAFTAPTVTSVPWVEGFATTTLPAQWSASSFFLSGTSNVGANPGNALVLNLWSSTTTGNFSTPNLGPVASNQLFTFDYRIINYSGTDIPGAGTGTYTLAVSTDFGATYTTLETFSNDGVAGWRNKSYNLAAYAGQYVKFRLTGTWITGDYYIGLDNFAVTALCEGTPNGGTVSVTSQSVCPSFPVAPITVTGASVDAGITYQWEQSTDGGTSWGNAVGGTGATTVTYQPPVYAGTVILYRLKVTCTNSSEEAFSTISEINGNPRPVPFTETFSDLATLTGWSTSGFSIGAVRGATGNPGNNALANLWASATTAQLTTASYGTITAGQALLFDYKLSNYASPYDAPAADSGSFEVFVSTNCGVSYTSLGVTTNDGVAGYRSKVYSLAPYVGQEVMVRILGTWVSGDYDLSIDNLSIMVPPPTITSFDPISVCEDSEATITLTGNYFSNASSVTIGSTETVFNVVNPTTITFTVPIGATTGLIYVTTPGGTAVSSSNLTVYPYPVNNPITGPDDKVCSNGTLQLTPGGAGSAWSSSNEAVATVDANGLVSGVSAGTAVISFSITDFGCTTTQDYTVTVYEQVVITTQPPSTKSIQTGTTSTVSVAATGDGLSYQWYYYSFDVDDYVEVENGDNFSGVDTNTLTIIDTPEEFDGYEFYCIVSGTSPCDAVQSSSVVISVGNTAITSDVVNQSLCDGGSATFSVETSGDVDTYTWYENAGLGFVPVSASTSGLTYLGDGTNSLTISGITTANNNYTYFVVVEGPANSVNSSVGVLTVGASVGISSQPVNTSSCYSGGSTSFVVGASGTPSSISWVYSTSATGPFTPVANNTPTGVTYNTTVSGTLGVTTASNTPVNTYYYQAIVNGVAPCTNVESNVVSLTIDNPTISTQPTAGSVLRGSSRTFTVASPTPGATYQWQRATAVGGPYTNVVDNTPAGITYSGADSATLTVTTSGAAATGGGNFYRAVVSSPSTCSVNSNGVALTIFDYCAIPTATSTASYFNAFTTTGGLTNINNTASGFSTGGYGNFTAQSASQYQNSAVSFTTALVGTTVGVAIWVDWNQDGTFQTTERVFNTGSYVSAASGSFTVPGTALLGATRMRIAMDFNATSPLACPTTGGRREIEDYTFIVVQQPACEGTPAPATVTASVANVCFSGTSTLTASGFSTAETGLSYQWYNTSGPISGANSATYTTPVLTAPETYYFRVTCANSGLFADSNSVTIGVNEPALVSTTPGERCGTGTVDLSAEGSLGTSLNWFTAPTGGQPIFTGSTFTTPVLNTTTTYYVAASIGSSVESAGKASSSGADGSFVSTNYGIVFTATNALTINSAVIYPVGTGTVTVALYNSTGTELLSTAAIPVSGTGVATPVTLPLNFAVAPGTGYRLLVKASTGITGLIRDFTNTFPYNSANMSVTGGWTGSSSTAYYFFYNMQVATGCTSNRTAVTATVTAPPALTLSGASTAICNGETSSSVTVTSNVADYDTYTWSPSEGVNGDATNGFTFNPTATTNYVLTATNSETGCANTVAFTVTVNALPLVYTILPENPAVCSENASAVLLSTSLPTPGSVTIPFGTNLESEGTNPAVYPATISGIPAGATISSVQLQFTNVNAINGSYRSEIRVALTGAHTLAATQISTLASGGLISPNPTVNVTGFTATSGTINLVLTETFNDGAAGVIDATFGSAQLVINFTAPSVTTTWAPTTGLYTDAAATVPYTGGNAASIYAKPTVETTYTSTVTTAIGSCVRTATTTVGITPATPWYADTDSDGFGNSEVIFMACSQPVGYVAVGGDCNDNNSSINPGATEI